MVTSPGTAGTPNEDFVGAVPGAVVLLDGAGMPETGSVCRHGVAWYSHTLGATMLGQLSRAPAADLVTTLAESIDQLTERHRHTCEVADPRSPQSTVAIVRFAEDLVDFLVLADTFVVLDSSDAGPRVVTDPREVRHREECTTVLRGLPTGTPEHERATLVARDALRSRRNQPGGYWVAKDDPHAASEAVTGRVSRGHVAAAALLSNGASRVVDPYRLAQWAEVMELLRTSGPDAVVRRVREAESAGRVAGEARADDATVAYCELGGSPRHRGRDAFSTGGD